MPAVLGILDLSKDKAMPAVSTHRVPLGVLDLSKDKAMPTVSTWVLLGTPNLVAYLR